MSAMETETELTDSLPPYKRLLIQAKNLQQTAKANVYKRVKLLARVFDDEQFRLDHGGDDFVLAGILDEYVADIGWGFMELRSILEHFPDEPAWRTGRLSRMHDEVVRARRARAMQESQPVRRKPRRVTNADFEAVKNENRELRAKFQAAIARGLARNETAQGNGHAPGGMEAEIIMLRKQLATARRRIAELEAENADLRKRLAEQVEPVA